MKKSTTRISLGRQKIMADLGDVEVSVKWRPPSAKPAAVNAGDLQLRDSAAQATAVPTADQVQTFSISKKWAVVLVLLVVALIFLYLAAIAWSVRKGVQDAVGKPSSPVSAVKPPTPGSSDLPIIQESVEVADLKKKAAELEEQVKDLEGILAETEPESIPDWEPPAGDMVRPRPPVSLPLEPAQPSRAPSPRPPSTSPPVLTRASSSSCLGITDPVAQRDCEIFRYRR